jgi:hypothetical protein
MERKEVLSSLECPWIQDGTKIGRHAYIMVRLTEHHPSPWRHAFSFHGKRFRAMSSLGGSTANSFGKESRGHGEASRLHSGSACCVRIGVLIDLLRLERLSAWENKKKGKEKRIGAQRFLVGATWDPHYVHLSLFVKKTVRRRAKNKGLEHFLPYPMTLPPSLSSETKWQALCRSVPYTTIGYQLFLREKKVGQ